MNILEGKEGVIFDLWNTLIRKKGKDQSSLVADHFNLKRVEVHEWIRIRSVGRGGAGKYSVFESLCTANELTFSENDKKFVDSLYGTFEKECEWIPGAQSILRQLRARGFKLGIISNTTDLSHHLVKVLKLDQLVDHILFSCDVGYLKPDPRIFMSILESMDLKIEDALMVGDKVTTDVLGAKTVGMDVILFDEASQNKDLQPNTSLTAIVSRLDQISILS